MRIVARRPIKPRLVTPSEYAQGGLAGFVVLKERGEPYFLGETRVLIESLGVGTYWRQDQGSLVIYGEGTDPDQDEGLLEDVLEIRRSGHVYGLWYSVYCTEGERGHVHQKYLTKITQARFDQSILEIQAISVSEMKDGEE